MSQSWQSQTILTILSSAHFGTYGTPVGQRQAFAAFASYGQLLKSWRDKLPAELEIEGRPLPLLSQSTHLTELFSSE
jgi:predicted secreted protein